MTAPLRMAFDVASRRPRVRRRTSGIGTGGRPSHHDRAAPRRSSCRRRGRPDLRADRRRHRARVGRGDRVAAVGPARPTCGPRPRPRRGHRGGDPLPGPGDRRHPGGDRAPRLGAAGPRPPSRGGTATRRTGRPCYRISSTAITKGRIKWPQARRKTRGSSRPRRAPPATPCTRDERADPPALVCQVGSTTLKYRLRAIDDLHAWLKAQRRLGSAGRGRREEARRRRHGGGMGPVRRTIRSAAGTACAADTAAGSACTCRRCWRSSAWPRSPTTPATTGCGRSRRSLPGHVVQPDQVEHQVRGAARRGDQGQLVAVGRAVAR